MKDCYGQGELELALVPPWQGRHEDDGLPPAALQSPDPQCETGDADILEAIKTNDAATFAGMLLLCVESTLLTGDTARIAEWVGVRAASVEQAYAAHVECCGSDRLQELLIQRLYG